MPLISVITVNYNNTSVTEELLNSIPTESAHFKVEIIVVDNGSLVNPVPFWTKKYPLVRFIRSDINLGFSKGNNLGIKSSSGEFLFLVNNDTVFTKNLIPDLISVFQKHQEVGIASPKIYYFSKKKVIQYAGFTRINFLTGRNRCIGQYEIDRGQYDKNTGPTGYVHGAAMMVRRQVIEKAGAMPEAFFLYYEEMDWCEKIRSAGFQIWFVPNAQIYHKDSVSVGKSSALKEYFMIRNRILFIRRNASIVGRLSFYIFFVFIVIPKNIWIYIKSGRIELIPVLLKATIWNLFNPTT